MFPSTLGSETVGNKILKIGRAKTTLFHQYSSERVPRYSMEAFYRKLWASICVQKNSEIFGHREAPIFADFEEPYSHSMIWLISNTCASVDLSTIYSTVLEHCIYDLTFSPFQKYLGKCLIGFSIVHSSDGKLLETYDLWVMIHMVKEQ